MKKTKGQIEASISAAITNFEKEQLGKGPTKVRTFIIQDMILVRLRGVLSPAELRLAGETGGAELIKQIRRRLIESTSLQFKNIIYELTGKKVISIHTDISSHTGERVLLFTLNNELEKELNKNRNNIKK
ncbi:MAG: DUF2294 domain-containing protein [Calditrichia bacterium]|nr:DUF2294 domain-containing protein [Calditrichia bacterium]